MHRLQRDVGCLRDLLWRFDVSPAESKSLITHLLDRGWSNHSTFEALTDLEGPDGHRLVIVPRTGRVQIRIHYLTPQAARHKVAERLLAEVITNISSAC